MTSQPSIPTVVRDASDLLFLWERLMGPEGFSTSTLWHVFLDRDGAVLRVILPIDDLPHEPDADGLRTLREQILPVILEEGATSVAMLLSRPGPEPMTASDRAWARTARAVYGPLSPWPIHFATRGRVRVFAPDDLLAA